MTLNRSFVTAILSGALAFGGLGVATAHHGNVSEHSTSGGKTRAQIEKMERLTTADLNRKSAMGPQLAMQMPATSAPITQPPPAVEQQPQQPPVIEQEPPQQPPAQQEPTEQAPTPDETPAATQPDDRAALAPDEPAEIAAAPGG